MTDPELVAILKRLAAGQPARSSHAGTFGAAAAAIEGLTRDVARLTAERDAVIDVAIWPWPGIDGGCTVQLPYRLGGYPGGRWYDGGAAGWYWFESRDAAVNAIRRAAKLGEGTT